MYWRHHYLLTEAVASAIPRKAKGRPSEAKRLRYIELRDALGVQSLDEVIERYHEYPGDLVDSGVVHNGSPKELQELVTIGAALRVAYKAGRSYPDHLMQTIRKVTLETLKTFGALDKKGYEADDMASLVVRLAGDEEDIILLTVDTDWLGLCSDRTTWVCATGYAPRVRMMLDGSMNAWASKRLKTTLEQPRDIWAIKVEQGDKSDNLPPGSPIGVIDLLAPVADHDLMRDSALVARAERMLREAPVAPLASKAQEALGFLKGHGVAPCVPELTAEQLYTPVYSNDKIFADPVAC
jgi:hypothetical protein